jgi:uncharacterized protein YlzI (FlbEa/FlbD family)
MFIQLTHTNSGDKILVRADLVESIRQKEGKTLIVTTTRGMYVNESVEWIRHLVETTIKEMNILKMEVVV